MTALPEVRAIQTDRSHPLLRRRPPLWVTWVVVWSVIAAAEYLSNVDGLKNLLYNVFGLGAGGAIVIGVFRNNAARQVTWLLLAAAVVLMSLGDITYTQLAELGDPPFPSLADAFYFAGYSCLTLSIFGLIVGRRGPHRSALLDASVVTIAAGLVFWVFFMEPVVTDHSLGFLEVAAAISYPLFDVGLIGLLTMILLGSGGRLPAFRLLLIGIAAFLASDVIYAFQSLAGNYEASLIDLGWLAGYTLLGAAALHPTMRRMVRTSSDPVHLTSRRMLLLASAALVAPVMAGAEQVLRGKVDVLVIVAGSGAIFLLVVVRLAGLVRSLHQLFDERVELQGRLERQALHDPLTDLPNRRRFLERLDVAYHAAAGNVAVLVLDVDDFKAINDTYGHAAGDELLVGLSARLQSTVRPGDTVARLGGDEFAIILPNRRGTDAAKGVAERILAALDAPMNVAGNAVRLRTSIGIAFMGDGESSADGLLRNADAAMYLAKSHGKHRSEAYRPDLSGADARRPLTEDDFRRGLAGEQFKLAYQPIYALGDDRVHALEALVGWDHPELGEIQPLRFIPVAELNRQIVPLGRWILEQACREVRELQRPGRLPIRLNVNVSAGQLVSPTLVRDVRHALSSSGLEPELLTLEITETALIELGSVLSVLEELHEAGVRIAIDDFGTGFSSIEHLARLPISDLKIDQSFVARIDVDGGRLIGAVVGFGRALALWTVAEGVETAEQLGRLREMGCDAAQGIFLGRPQTIEQLQLGGVMAPAPARAASRRRVATTRRGASPA